MILDSYKLEPNAENIDTFFDRIEVLFKGCVDSPRAREELKKDIQGILNKGLIAGNARYRLKAHLYLAGIAVIENGRDQENVEKWKEIATIYKRAEKDLQDTPMEINPYFPEFLHDNFYAYALYKTDSVKKAEQVAARKPFTPK